MNKNILLIITFLALAISTKAQEKFIVTNDTIYINQYKTAQIVFDATETFEFIDIGTSNYQITYRELGNVIVIQSIVNGFELIPTNIFIKTKDNNIFNFILTYKETPKHYTYLVKTTDKQTAFQVQGSTANTAASRNILIDNIVNHKTKAFRPSTEILTDIKCEFHGLFLHNGKLYYKLKIDNNSNLDYKIRDYYVYIKNQKRRRTVASERVVPINNIFTNSSTVNGNTSSFIVLEFEQFSLNKKEDLYIEIKEGLNGQRDFKLLIPHFVTNKPLVLKI